MNKKADTELDPYRSLLLMSEIEKDELLSQRELSSRLGVALGLVNSYLKNLVAKGYVRVKTFPRNRYAYLLTPKGMAEKGRLAYQHLNYFTSLYTTTRQDFRVLFQGLSAQGVTEVAFCGVDEVAEIAYLSLGEAGMALAAVMDDEPSGQAFFGRPVVSLAEGLQGGHPVVVTSLKKRRALQEQLLALGADAKEVFSVGGDQER